MYMNAQLKLLLYISLVAGILYFIQQKYNIFEISFEKKESKQEESENFVPKVEILNEDETTIIVEVEIADANELRALGLSGRKELGDYQGMLFIMDEQDVQSFWMKDMEIELDLIYINIQGNIVDIFENQKPCTPTFCPTIQSPYESKYILEVIGGFVETNRVEVGNEVVFNISSEN